MINYTAGTVLAKKVNAQNNFVEEELDCTDINAVAITGTQTISGNKTFVNDVYIQGSLAVSGTQTYLHTQQVYVEDNMITLNSTITGTPSINGGIEVQRGTSTNAQILWNEALDRWEAGISGSTDRILGQSDLTSISGYINVQDAAAVTSGQSYTNSQIAAYSGTAESRFVNVSGDTMIGFLTLNADPTASGHAATKQYVDNQVSGDLTIGTIDSVTKSSNAAVISGGKLYLQTADASYPGAMSIGTQTIAGAKTFNNTVSINTASGVSAISVRVNSAGGFNVDTSGNINVFGQLFSSTFKSFGSDVYIGTATNNSMFFTISGIYGWYIDTSRNLIQEGTYGGNIILNKETANYALYLDASKQIRSESALAASRGGTGLAGSTGYRILYGNNAGSWTTNSAFIFNDSSLVMPGGGAMDFNWSTGAIKVNSSDSHRILIDAGNNAITLYEYGTIKFNIGTSPGTTISYIDSSGFHASTNMLLSQSANVGQISCLNIQLSSNNGLGSAIELWANSARQFSVTNGAANVWTNLYSPNLYNNAAATFYIYGNSQEVRVKPVNTNDWTSWIFGVGGIFTPWSNNSQDIGVAANFRVKNIYVQGYVGPFTGCHIYKVTDGENLEIGDTVSINNKQIVKTTISNDPSCIGIVAGNTIEIPVISGAGSIIADSFNIDYDLSITGMDIRAVASVGDSTTGDLSGFKVCDEGGAITVGTLLVTASGYPGYVKAQSDNIIRSYTVGKALEDVTFSGGIAHNIYGVIYCG